MRASRAERWRRECLQIEESLSAVSRLCDRRMLPQRPAGLPMVLRAFLRRGLCLRPGACSLRGGGLFVGKAGGTVEAGMSANRGKFVSSIVALRPTDAPATTGRSVDGFEGVFASWALSASRGLFPSRGRAFLRARRAERWGGNVCKSRKVCQQYRGFATGADAPATTGRSAAGFFEAVFASWALSASRGLSPSRGRAFLRGGARSVVERWQSGQNGWGQACLRGGARQL